MGLSLKKLGEALLAQANPFDNGKTASTVIRNVQPTPRPVQQTQQVFNQPVNNQVFTQPAQPVRRTGFSGVIDNVRDKVDANTPLDQWKRQQQGRTVIEKTLQDDIRGLPAAFKKDVMTNPLSPVSVGKEVFFGSGPLKYAADAMSSGPLEKPTQGVRDLLDANTAKDFEKRNKEELKMAIKAKNEGKVYSPKLNQTYMQQQESLGRRGRNNFGDQMAGGFAENVNTLGARLYETPETLRGTVADLTGNDAALAASLERQKKNTEKLYGSNKGGILNTGTIYDNVDQAKNLGLMDTTKRVAGGQLEGASLVVGGGALPNIAKSGLKGLASYGGKTFAGGAMGMGGNEMSTNPDANAWDIAKASTIGGVSGLGLGIAGDVTMAGVSKGIKGIPSVVNAAGDTLDNAKQAYSNVPSKQGGFVANPLNKGDDIAPVEKTPGYFQSEGAKDRAEELLSTVEGLKKDGFSDEAIDHAIKNIDIKGDTAWNLKKAAIAYEAKQFTPANNDVVDVQNAIAEAYSKGDIEYANQLNDSLDPPDRIIGNKPSTDQYGNIVDPETGNIIDKPKVALKEPKVEPPKVEPEGRYNSSFDDSQSKLGNMASDFFGTDGKIGLNELTDLGKRIAQRADDAFAKIGSSFESVAQKIQKGVREGKTNHLDAGLTPDESAVLKQVQAEMGYVRQRAKLGNKNIKEGDFGEMYLPNVGKEFVNEKGTLAGLLDKNPGNEITRTNKIPLEDLNNKSNIVADYIVDYGETRATNAQRTIKAVQEDHPEANYDQVTKAASEIIGWQEQVNKIKTKIGVFGLGSKKFKADGVEINTADTLEDIGRRIFNNDILEIKGRSRGITLENKLDSVIVNNQKLTDFLGIRQHNEAGSFAMSETLAANGNRDALAEAVGVRLSNDYNINPNQVDYFVDQISRISSDVPDEVVAGRLQSIYQITAKRQLVDTLQRVKITNPKLKKEVNLITNQILREGTITNELSSKWVQKTNQIQNAIFRKLNLSSALNELSDLPSFKSAFGKHFSLIPDMGAVKEFGLGEIDSALTPFLKMAEDGVPMKTIMQKIKSAGSTINTKTNLYKFSESYKMGVAAGSAKRLHMAEGLAGDDLTKAVIKDYRELALPVDELTKTILDNYPLYTQYMSWGVRNIRKEGRLAMGRSSAGILKDKSDAKRIARNLYMNLPAKTVFWLTSNALKGTPILGAFGITDFTNLTSGDYSGIENEDKTLFDRVASVTNASTTMSLVNTAWQSVEKERLKNSDKYKNADYNPYENNDIKKQLLAARTPQIVKNVTGAKDMMGKGYSENAKGLVQYEAPTDPYNKTKAYVFGKGQTANAREYSGNKNIIDRIAQTVDKSPVGFAKTAMQGVSDMAREQLGLQDKKFNYPLSDKYTKLYKDTKEKSGDTKAVIESYRNINKDKVAFASNEPNAKKIVDALSTFNKDNEYDTVSPEKWSKLTANNRETQTAIEELKKRAIKNNKDFGDPIDPIFDLPKDRQATIIALRGMKTGEDQEIKGMLKNEQWYKEFNDKQTAYYDAKATRPYEGDMKQSQRVTDYYKRTGENPSIPANTAKLYPQIKEYYDIKAKDPDAAKQFSNDNNLGEQFDKLNYDKWVWTNDMRYLEGGDPIAFKDWDNASFGFEDDEAKLARDLYFKNKENGTDYAYNKSKSYSRSSGGSSGGSSSGSKTGLNSDAPNLSKYEISTDAQVAKPTVKKAAAVAKVGVAAKKATKPKVSIKKSKA